MADWKPAASLEQLQNRAALLQSIRQFFAVRDVLEVETPLLGRSTATDTYIQSFVASDPARPQTHSFYLQTSPEFAMKRLLAAGSGPIYQVCKAFRLEESTRTHNPEFTMLEWYRPGFSLTDLMDEVAQLLQTTLACADVARISYRELFEEHLDFDPHQITDEDLQRVARSRIDFGTNELTATDCLQQLLAQCIEPNLPEYCFIYHYPVAQAALAVVAEDEQSQPVAQRFELFGRGMEIANGYLELTDEQEQRRRFTADNARRKAAGLPEIPVDEALLAALGEGLPACAGVALGVDRLLLLQTRLTNISDVLSFRHG